MVTTERCNNSRLVGENDLVFGSGREESLEESDGGVEDDGTFSASLNPDLHFVVVDEVRADALDVGGRRAIEVGGAEKGAKAVGLNLVYELVSIKQSSGK